LHISISISFSAVQNERQPRNSAQVRQDQLETLDPPGIPAAYTVSATHPAFMPGQNTPHFVPRFLTTPLDTINQQHDSSGRGELKTDDFWRLAVNRYFLFQCLINISIFLRL
jgi:hypothetical protein